MVPLVRLKEPKIDCSWWQKKKSLTFAIEFFEKRDEPDFLIFFYLLVILRSLYLDRLKLLFQILDLFLGSDQFLLSLKEQWGVLIVEDAMVTDKIYEQSDTKYYHT